jgi:hypothetical protein
MVQKPIEDRAGDHGVAEHVAPGAQALIAGDDDRAAFIATGDQLEEQVGALTVDRQIADFIDQERLRFSQQLESFFQPAFRESLPSVVMSAVAVTNRVRTPCSQAFIPSAIAK